MIVPYSFPATAGADERSLPALEFARQPGANVRVALSPWGGQRMVEHVQGYDGDIEMYRNSERDRVL